MQKFSKIECMRKRFEVQLGLGQVAIEDVKLPLNSRDELPPLLVGLQWIFKTPELNSEIFTLLEKVILDGKKSHTGRPGMDLWHVLVLGVIRLGLNCDYDRLEHIANYDLLVRKIMGLSDFCENDQDHFNHKTISDNVCHLDADVLDRINLLVSKHGLKQLKKKPVKKHLKSR